MTHKAFTLFCAVGLLLAPLKGQGSSVLSDVVEEADAIVAGEIGNERFEESIYVADVLVSRVLKGKGSFVPGASIHVEYSGDHPRGRRAGADQTSTHESGVMFLRESFAGWRLIRVNSSGLGLRSGFLPMSKSAILADVQDGAAVDKQIQQIVIAAIESEGPMGELGPKFLLSPVERRDVYVRWSNSENKTLRVYGLTGRVSAGDEAAVELAAREWSTLRSVPRVSLLGSALSSVRTTSAPVVRALGALATDRAEVPPQTRRGLTYALGAIHTADTLPFLAELLRSDDPLARSFAVGGFSAFVTNMQMLVGSNDAEAVDEVLNPGRRRSIPDPTAPFETEETRRFVHFGPFRDSSEESSYVEFWSGWYARARGTLGVAE